jgi:tetratricopeptide (TPR) repeat protein
LSLFSANKFDMLIERHKAKTGRRLTIREVAKETSISPAYLTLLKNGQRNNPSMDMVIKISHFFQVPPEELLEDGAEHVSNRPAAIETRVPSDLQAERTLEMCEQLIASKSEAQALELLNLLQDTAAYSPQFQITMELIQAQALLGLKRYDECKEILAACLTHPLSKEQKAKALHLQGRIYYVSEKYSQAIAELLEASELAEEAQAKGLLYQIHYLLGICYKETYEYGSSIYYFESAQRLFPSTLPILRKGHLLMGMGNTYLRLMSLGAAMSAFVAAERIYQEVGDQKFIADIQHNIARVKMMEDEYEAAILLLQESLKTHQVVGDHLGIAADLLEIANCYHHLQQWEKVREFAFRSSVTFENGNKQGLAAQTKLLMLEAMLQLKIVDSSMYQILDEIIGVFLGLEWHLLLANAYHLKARLLVEEEQAEEALTFSMKALDLYGQYASTAKKQE